MRVSTAYEFYKAVKDHVVLREQSYMHVAKRPFEANNYILYYVAANEIDAEGKEYDILLDRSQMWDNTGTPGSSSSYEFVGLQNIKLHMRALPCPCYNCVCGEYNACANFHIVGRFDEIAIKEIITQGTEYISLPLESHTVRVLKAFVKHHKGRVPGIINKPTLIRLINDTLVEYVLPMISLNDLLTFTNFNMLTAG